MECFRTVCFRSLYAVYDRCRYQSAQGQQWRSFLFTRHIHFTLFLIMLPRKGHGPTPSIFLIIRKSSKSSLVTYMTLLARVTPSGIFQALHASSFTPHYFWFNVLLRCCENATKKFLRVLMLNLTALQHENFEGVRANYFFLFCLFCERFHSMIGHQCAVENLVKRRILWENSCFTYF